MKTEVCKEYEKFQTHPLAENLVGIWVFDDKGKVTYRYPNPEPYPVIDWSMWLPTETIIGVKQEGN